MPTIPSLLGSYIDQTYQRLVQVSGSSFADGLGNPITLNPGSVNPTPGYLPYNSASLFQDSVLYQSSSNIGIGTTSPVGKLQVDLNNIDYINTGGAGSHIVLNNPNDTAGQSVITSIISGSVVGKWRTDYIGSVTNVSYGNQGYHMWYTNGDYSVGTPKMVIQNNGNVKIATNNITDAGYKLEVNGTVALPNLTNNTSTYVVGIDDTTGELYKQASSTPYKVYTALLTQTGGTSIRTINWDDPAEALVTGVTYQITADGGVKPNFTNIGAPNNNVGTYFVATGPYPTSWGHATVQYNAGAPVATVLENTIGNIWFVYENPGYYFVKSDGLFTDSKTFCIIGNVIDLDGYPASVGLTYQGDINTLALQTSPLQSNSNGLLSKTPIEIRVYN